MLRAKHVQNHLSLFICRDSLELPAILQVVLAKTGRGGVRGGGLGRVVVTCEVWSREGVWVGWWSAVRSGPGRGSG